MLKKSQLLSLVVLSLSLLTVTLPGISQAAGKTYTEKLEKGEKLRVVANRCTLATLETSTTRTQRIRCTGKTKRSGSSAPNTIVLNSKDKLTISAKKCFLSQTKTSAAKIDVKCTKTEPTATPTLTPTQPAGTATPTATATPTPTPTFNANALLTGNQLVNFSTDGPAAATVPAALTGVVAGDSVVAIDRRPQNGMLYGIGYNATNGTVQLYAISTESNTAVTIGDAESFSDGVNPVRVGVDTSTQIGMDFNPAVDRIRVVTSNGQNFRINPNTGSLVDGDGTGLTSGTVSGTNPDGPINGAITTVSETAYTNAFANNGNISTQYTVDSTSDNVCLQNPPNTGTQTLCKTLNPTLVFVNGFDIPRSVVSTSSNTAVTTGSAFALGQTTGGTTQGLLSIDLTNGAVSAPVQIGTNTSGLASFALNQTVGADIIGLSGSSLIKFNATTPGTTTTVTTTGITAGETLVGLDWRPATGQLFALGFNSANGTGSATLYRLDPQTGVASIIGSAGSIANGAGSPISLSGATSFGFDFNPQVDRIRVVTNAGQNFRVNPNDGTVVGNTLDTTVSGLTNSVDGAAYTNSFAGTSTTTLYTLDAASDALYIQNPPNAGVQTNTLPITVSGSSIDFTASSGFDIGREVRTSTANSAATSGVGYAALTVGGVTKLYSIALATGAATDLGAIGTGSGAFSGLTVGQVNVN